MTQGFFSKKETQSTTRPDGKTYSCFSCGLYRGPLETPKMKPSGKGSLGILNVFDFVTAEDDLEGAPGKSKEWMYIKEKYAQVGIDLNDDCINTYAVKCTPVDERGVERSPSNYEVDCCRLHLMKVIQTVKPKIIMVFGETALRSVIGNRWKGSFDGIEKWRGWVIPDQQFKCYIAPMYSISSVLNDDKGNVKIIWRNDFLNALYHMKQTFPEYIPPEIIKLKDLSVLSTIKPNSIVAFDYETTGLKPHSEEHKIICASVAVSENKVYVFMMPKSRERRKPFIDLLKNKHIKKMAHNMKFEETWSFNILKTRVRGWYWDSMQAAHILDNRSGITGLKFQTYVQFGIVDYSSEINKWLQADDKNANSVNTIEELVSTAKGRNKLLEYCALDSIFEYRLALKQQVVIEELLPF
jgi:uracil-DNA glycosylase family 4